MCTLVQLLPEHETLQLKRISKEHDLLASASNDQSGVRRHAVFLFHPHSVNEGIGIELRSSTCFQMYPACSNALLMCCNRASCVGGILYNNLVPVLN